MKELEELTAEIRENDINNGTHPMNKGFLINH